MNRWILAMLMGAIALAPTVESARANADPVVSQAESSVNAPLPEPDALSRTWAQIRQAQHAATPEQANEHLAQADTIAATVQDLTRRQQLWSAIAAQHAALGNMEQAIALTNRMGYDTYAPEYCCVPLRTEAEIAIAQEYAKAGQIDEGVQFATGIEPEFSRNQVFGGLIEQLAQDGEIEQAIALLNRITNDESQVARAQHSIIRGYITNQQFVDGLAFSQKFTNADEKAGAQLNLVQGAIRAGEYPLARQIAQEIGAPWSKLEALRLLALAYSGIGDTEAARELVDQGYALLNTPENQSFSHWVRNYAEIGAYDDAIRLAEQLPGAYDKAEAYIFIGQVLVQHGKWNEAFSIAQRVQDGELQPLAEYEDPKISLLNVIVKESASAGQYDFAVRVARSYSRPEQRVNALRVVAKQAQQTGNTPQAVTILWEAFELAKTIERIGYHADRHSYIQTSNAPLLVELAEEFTELGETDRAIAALDLAVESAQAFEYDSYYDILVGQSLEWRNIAQAYIHAQQPDKAQTVLGIATDLANTMEDLGVRVQQLAQISQLYVQMNRPEQAQALLGQALQIGIGLEDSLPKLWAMGALVEGYAVLGDNQQTQAIVERFLQASQTIEEPYQRNALLGQIAVALAKAPDPAMAVQLANNITEDTLRAQILADIAAKYTEAEQPQHARYVTEQLLDSAEHMWEPIQRDAALSNLIINRYATPGVNMPVWQYELAVELNAMIHDPRTRAANEFAIALGYARQGDMVAAEASVERGVEAAIEIGDRALRQDTLWTSLDEMLRADEPQLAAILLNGFETPKTRVVVLRQLAQSYVREGNMTQANALIERAKSEAEAITDLPSRMRILNSIDNQQATWISSLNYSIPL